MLRSLAAPRGRGEGPQRRRPAPRRRLALLLLVPCLAVVAACDEEAPASDISSTAARSPASQTSPVTRAGVPAAVAAQSGAGRYRPAVDADVLRLTERYRSVRAACAPAMGTSCLISLFTLDGTTTDLRRDMTNDRVPAGDEQIDLLLRQFLASWADTIGRAESAVVEQDGPELAAAWRSADDELRRLAAAKLALDALAPG